MWVVFLLSAMVIALCFMLIVYVGNKVIIAMERDCRESKKVKKERK